MRIGMLTGGGDAPGLNAVIRAVVRKATDIYGDVVIGFRNGWKGAIDAEVETLTSESVKGILPRGGTILGTRNKGSFVKIVDGRQVSGPVPCAAPSCAAPAGAWTPPSRGSDTKSFTIVHTFAEGKAALGAGKTIDYVGVEGQIHFDRYQNSAGVWASLEPITNKPLAVLTPAQVSAAEGRSAGQALAASHRM